MKCFIIFCAIGVLAQVGFCAGPVAPPTTTTTEATTETTEQETSETTEQATTTTEPSTTTTEPTTTTAPTTTTTVPTTTKAPNAPPRPEWLITLKYYYNYGLVLHAFSADAAGYKKIQSNGIGYSPSAGSGPLGRSLAENKIEDLKKVCGAADKLKKLYFTRKGNAYHHTFGSGDIFGGWVATEANACRASIPMYKYTCAVSADIMYAEDLGWNTWYAGRWDRNNPIKFYLW